MFNHVLQVADSPVWCLVNLILCFELELVGFCLGCYYCRTYCRFLLRLFICSDKNKHLSGVSASLAKIYVHFFHLFGSWLQYFFSSKYKNFLELFVHHLERDWMLSGSGDSFGFWFIFVFLNLLINGQVQVASIEY